MGVSPRSSQCLVTRRLPRPLTNSCSPAYPPDGEPVHRILVGFDEQGPRGGVPQDSEPGSGAQGHGEACRAWVRREFAAGNKLAMGEGGGLSTVVGAGNSQPADRQGVASACGPWLQSMQQQCNCEPAGSRCPPRIAGAERRALRHPGEQACLPSPCLPAGLPACQPACRSAVLNPLLASYDAHSQLSVCLPACSSQPAMPVYHLAPSPAGVPGLCARPEAGLP